MHLRGFIIFFSCLLVVFFYWNYASEGDNKSTIADAEEEVFYEEIHEDSEVEQTPKKEIDTAKETLPKIYDEIDFYKTYPGKWSFLKDENDKIQSILGDIIPDIGKSEQSLNDFLKQIKPLLASGDYSITAVAKENSTDLMKSFSAQQKAYGLDVYQGSVSVLTRQKDSGAYMVNNQLKDIQDVSTTAEVSRDAARVIAKKKYPKTQITTPAEPKIFSDNAKTELAWVFKIKQLQLPRKTFELVLSAKTGEVLHVSKKYRQD